MTMEITNDRLEEAIKQYAAERTKENLTTVLNLLRPTKLYVPAMLKAPDQPTPCFLKNNKGEQFFVAYTSKEQMPEEPKSQALLFMPFPACNNIVVGDIEIAAGVLGSDPYLRSVPRYGCMARQCADTHRAGTGNDFHSDLYP